MTGTPLLGSFQLCALRWFNGHQTARVHDANVSTLWMLPHDHVREAVGVGRILLYYSIKLVNKFARPLISSL
jgi:hypothetical protein